MGHTPVPCPDCGCCTSHLCWLAASIGEPCSWLSEPADTHVGCPCAARTADSPKAPVGPEVARRAALIRVLTEAARRCAGNEWISLLDLASEAEGGVHAHQHKVAGLAYYAAYNAGARDSLSASRNAEILREVAAVLLNGEDVDTSWRTAADRMLRPAADGQLES